MKLQTKFATLAVAGMIAAVSPALVGAGFAGTTAPAAAKPADPVAQTLSKSEEKALIKTVDEAYSALREIRAARLAIFDGQPEEAMKMATAAQKDLKTADGYRPSHAMTTNKALQDGDAYLPFDSNLVLAEGFVPTPEKERHLKEANGKLSKGDSKGAAETLKLANIDVTVNVAMIPAVNSLKNVNDALELLKSKNYYEANLALKAVEDSVVIDGYALNSIPVQGKHG